jgi:hypothetical protein
MAFSDTIKLEAKQRANFRCVVCHEPWVEVHHIVPEADGGPDNLENAAPVCGACHLKYGGNPELRKQLREMRDHWWERCAAEMYQHGFDQLSRRLDELRAQYLSDQVQVSQVLQELKSLFIEHFRSAEAAIESATTVGEVLGASSSFTTGAPPVYPVLRGPDAVPTRCFRCGYVAQYGSKCVHCGAVSDDF